jgi:hypothetical protein
LHRRRDAGRSAAGHDDLIFADHGRMTRRFDGGFFPDLEKSFWKSCTLRFAVVGLGIVVKILLVGLADQLHAEFIGDLAHAVAVRLCRKFGDAVLNAPRDLDADLAMALLMFE